MKLFGGIEAGGTKFVCMVASDPQNIIAEERFPTTSPVETIGNVFGFFSPYKKKGELDGVGIASFGPVDLNGASPSYGYITTTPKPGWNNFNFYGKVKTELDVPVAFDTDVNAAAIGEQYWSPIGDKPDPFIYVTVGTGIGVGVIVNGAPLHGLIHAEAGHMLIPHDFQKDPFPGICPIHGDCLEGLASGPSMKKRWGQAAETLPENHPAWQLEADYIATGLVNLIYVYSPRQIVLGGGVSLHPSFLDMVRRKIPQINNGYIRSQMIEERINDYIRAPILGNRSGALGAIAMVKILMNGK